MRFDFYSLFLITSTAVVGCTNSIWAVEQIGTDGSTYFDAQHYVDPSAQIPGYTVSNWNSGWGQTGVTGWNLVGQVNTSGGEYGSGVYLGNGWVITAEHVGTDAQNSYVNTGGMLSTFQLNGASYQVNQNTYQVLNYTGGASDAGPGTKSDVALFRLTTTPTLLPAVTLSLNLPVDSTPTVLVGFGNTANPPLESWGTGSVTPTFTNQEFHDGVTISTDYGIFTSLAQGGDPNNRSFVYPGDSGGADFVFNVATQKWELAGINEFIAPSTSEPLLSGFVQVDAYTSQIEGIINAPEPSTWTLSVLGIGVFLIAQKRGAKVFAKLSCGFLESVLRRGLRSARHTK